MSHYETAVIKQELELKTVALNEAATDLEAALSSLDAMADVLKEVRGGAINRKPVGELKKLIELRTKNAKTAQETIRQALRP